MSGPVYVTSKNGRKVRIGVAVQRSDREITGEETLPAGTEWLVAQALLNGQWRTFWSVPIDTNVPNPEMDFQFL